MTAGPIAEFARKTQRLRRKSLADNRLAIIFLMSNWAIWRWPTVIAASGGVHPNSGGTAK